ncbi:MAG: hypothetical protein QM756_17080 [Polyangiaceae bacterium]
MRMLFGAAHLRGSLLSLVCSIALVACSKDRPAAVEAPTAGSLAAPPAAAPEPAAAVATQAPAAASGEPAAPAPAAAGAARVVEPNFELSLSAVGAYETGKPGQAQIVLDAKAPFHVNDKYPYKFKPKDDAGLTFPAPVVGKDNVKLETARATMTVPFSVQSAGKHTLAGQFSFSVCTDDKCLIEKRDLSLVLEAK